ncbi:tetratricopeptide repeat protein [uncultured Duncaniella sp.]|uniref:tetratricopeptide repeat protein n=1 Tax=uncultured Duncaniella sp. TaxID=2768039 RepID=UPI0025A9FD60|nr:tetratricopeptide repeat protein [uncultured Duncaniella sp.]
MKRLPVILIPLVILAMALTATGRGRKPAVLSIEDAAKADYLYLEALRAKSQGNFDAAFSLLSRAKELNPTDMETGLELSNFLLIMSSEPTDTADMSRGVEMLRAYWDANPSDYYTGVKYGLMCQRRLERDEAIRVWGTLHRLYPEKVEIAFQLAEVLAQGGPAADRDRAIAIYDSIEALEGPNLTLSGNKIQLYFNENDTASILAEADRLRESSPSNVEFMVFSGKVYSMFGKREEALKFFDRACELDPSSGLAYYSKAEFYNSVNDSVGYDREVFNALKQNSLDVNTKLSILRGYIQQMYTDSLQRPRIIQLFDTLIVQHPLEHDIHDSYARYLIIARDYAAAAEQEEQTLGLDPADPEGWEMLSSLYLQIDSLDKAEDAIVRSLYYYPDNARQHVVLGSIYTQRKETAKGMEEFRKALSLADKADVELLSSIYTSIGDNMYQQQLSDSSYVYYRKALQYNPGNMLALNNCAYHMAVEGKDLDEALHMIEKVMNEEKDNPTSLDTYAWVLFKRKDYAKAREMIDRTIELTDEADMSADVLEHAGDIYFMDGEPDMAVDFWKRAMKYDPDNELLQRKVRHKTYFFK